MIGPRSFLIVAASILALVLLAPLPVNAQVTIYHVKVVVGPASTANPAEVIATYCDAGCTQTIWNKPTLPHLPITLQPGQTLVLTQTGLAFTNSIPSSSGGNFDTSDRVRDLASPFTDGCTPANPCSVKIYIDTTGSGLPATPTYSSDVAGDNIDFHNQDNEATIVQEQAPYSSDVLSPQAATYSLRLGYADNAHGCTTNCLPSPFDGTNGTTKATYFIGAGGAITAAQNCGSNCYDGGAHLITGKSANLQTVTQGGWGAPAHGNNPGTILNNNFSKISPVVIGSSAAGCFSLIFNSATAIRGFLPQGGPPSKLAASATNPTNSAAGVFAGQVLALQLNVSFSGVNVLPFGLGDYILTSGPAAGKSVSQILADANTALGCGTLPSYASSISALNDIVDSINEKFD